MFAAFLARFRASHTSSLVRLAVAKKGDPFTNEGVALGLAMPLLSVSGRGGDQR